jgi:hypothetical protein
MKIRHLVIPVALVFASCSGSDAASDTTAAPSTDSTDVTTPSAPATETVSTETVSTDAPAETTPDTETESTESESSVPPATDAPPATGGFVIDGPARVRPSCDSLARGVSNFALEAGGA